MEHLAALTQTDLLILKWIGSIDSEDMHQVDVKIRDQELILNCRSAYLAFHFWKRRRTLLTSQQPLDLTVKLNNRFFDSTLRTKQQMNSSWLQQNRSTFDDFKSLCTTAIHAETDQFPYLAIQPLYGIEDVLNKPIRELLNQPLNIVASEIAGAKRHAIERAIANGGSATETYSYQWLGSLWQMECIARYLAGHGEVLVHVKPAKGEEWHYGFWQNWNKSPA